jgi:multiple sugar transport system substrate-binding protein
VTGIEQPNLPKFVYMNEVEPLDEWIKNDPDFDPSVFYKECMDEGNWDNVQWAIPDTFSPVCLWYNKNLFDDSGVKYPNRDWTIDDLMAAARKLTKDLNGDNIPDIWGFYTNNNHWNRYPCWIWMTGGEFMTPDGLHATFDSPKVVAGITWLANLALKDRLMPSSTVLGAFTSGNLFIAGKLAMTTETRYALGVFFQEKNRDKIRAFKWDVCELPHDQKRATTFVCGLNMIPRTVPPERKKMAWDYIKFMSDVPGQEVVAANNAGLPARREIAEKLVTHPGTSPENDRAFLDSVSYSRYFYWPFPADAAFLDARSDLQGVWGGVLDPLPVCQKITVNINKAVDDFLRQNPGRPLPVKTKWVPIDKKAKTQEAAAPAGAAGS